MRAVGITQAALCRKKHEEEERERNARCVIARPSPLYWTLAISDHVLRVVSTLRGAG